MTINETKCVKCGRLLLVLGEVGKDQCCYPNCETFATTPPVTNYSVPKAVYDALRAWTGAEPSQSVLARALEEWGGPGDEAEFATFRVHEDPSVPPGTVEIRDSAGKTLGRIVNLDSSPAAPCPKCGLLLTEDHDCPAAPPAQNSAPNRRCRGYMPGLGGMCLDCGNPAEDHQQRTA